MPEFDRPPDPETEGGDPPPGGDGGQGATPPAGIGSPPPVSPGASRRNADDVRRRLAALARLLRQRFDRRAWDEYLRLRRAEKHGV